MQSRACPACSRPLIRREGETSSNFRRRRFCDTRCANPRTPDPAPRPCGACGKPLARKANESPSWYARRIYCDRVCRFTAQPLCGRGKGVKLPPRKVPCSECGAILVRAVHFRDSKCERCDREARRVKANARNAAKREQSRRYRILMHALGWQDDQFADLLAYLRGVPWAYLDDGHPVRDLAAGAA